MNSIRLGQIGGNKNAFYYALFNKDSTQVLAYTFNGCFYLWKRGEDFRNWDQLPTVSGHFSRVTDICWNSQGNFLVSTSKDQTTRVYSQVKFQPQTNGSPSLLAQRDGFYELSRAQIHGYDINCIGCRKVQMPDDDREFCDVVICGADEKILRALEPPSEFINIINTMSNTKYHLYFPDKNVEKNYLDLQYMKENDTVRYKGGFGGQKQVLGLMTKAIKEDRQNFYFKEGGSGDEMDELDRMGLGAD